MRPRISKILSVVLHAGVVFALIHFAAVQEMPVNKVKQRITWVETTVKWHIPPGNSKGGGGGPDLTPPSEAPLPKTQPKQFVPPTTRKSDHVPVLPVEPSIVGAFTAAAPPVIVGDPTGRIGPPSDGFGGDTGIGRGGKGGGVGENRGPQTGDGDGLITGRGKAGSFTRASIIRMMEPEFTEEARKARLQGTVVLAVDIDENGHVQNIRVQRSLGLGLDEKAVEAVKKWLFRPATRNGKPFRSSAFVEVNFHLL